MSQTITTALNNKPQLEFSFIARRPSHQSSKQKNCQHAYFYTIIGFMHDLDKTVEAMACRCGKIQD